MTRIFEDLLEIYKDRCICNEGANSLTISDGGKSALVVFDDNAIYVSGQFGTKHVKNDYNSLPQVLELVKTCTHN